MQITILFLKIYFIYISIFNLFGLHVVLIRRNINFLNVLFLLAYLFITYQLLQNKHAHFYPNGMVVHSHPFNNDDNNPINDHKHSKQEICFYQSLNFDYFSHSGALYIEAESDYSHQMLVPSEVKLPNPIWLQRSDSRDPPFNSCLTGALNSLSL